MVVTKVQVMVVQGRLIAENTSCAVKHLLLNLVVRSKKVILAFLQRKPKKDPNAPKRPPTAYMQWLNENRSALKKENPGLSITELSKVAGQQWKTVDQQQKEVRLSDWHRL